MSPQGNTGISILLLHTAVTLLQQMIALLCSDL